MNKIKNGKYTANNGVLIMIFLIKAIIMPIDNGVGVLAENTVAPTETTTSDLTAISWDHAVNSQTKLKSALENDVNMIEADVFIGKLMVSGGVKEDQVIMAHGPNEVESDLSLEDFILQINDYNKDKTTGTKKGIKLDFKSIDAFTKSKETLKTITGNYAVWLNADILKGPVEARTQPVESKAFLALANEFPLFTLSVGWTTRWTDAGVTSGKYTDDNVKEMIKVLETLTNKQQPITFPVRAGLVATSHDEMKKLLDTFKEATLTVWSSDKDEVNVPELQKLIQAFGVHKVYLDVPKSLSDKLDLGPNDKPSGSSANELSHIGLLSIAIFILAKLI